MQEGSQIVLKNQSELVLNNSTLQSSCGNMWKGIKLTEQSTLKVQNNSLIRDAQFAINLIDPNSLYLGSNSQLRNNYIGIYSPSKTNSITFSNFIKGTFTITGGSTLNPFFNQNPAPINNNPLAGILLNDFDNFDLTVPGGNNFSIYNLNAGVVINRGSATFKNVRFDQIYRYNSYQSVSSFPFSGSSVFGSGKTSKPTSILVGGSLLYDRCSFSNGLYGVHLKGNAQCSVISNSLTNFNTSIRINNCNNKPQNIIGNTITDFLNGVYFINNPSSSALINISNNLFNSNILQLGLNNPAIWYNNYSPSKTNLLIQYNVINNISKASSRGCSNGITINNVLNPLTPNTTALVDQNIIYLSQHQTDFIQNSNVNYTGISLNQCGSLLVQGNLVDRRSLALNTDPNYPILVTNPQFRLIGIDVNLTTLSTIRSNTLISMGSTMKFTSGCLGTQLFCNSQFSSNRGINVNGATMSDQGSANSSNDNTWTNFGTVLRVYGPTLPLPSTWYHQSTSQLNLNPHSGAIKSTSIGIAPNSICSTNSPSPDFILRSDSTFQSIIEDNIYYPIYPINNIEIAQSQAYYLLEQEAQLQALEASNQSFYDNYDLTVGAELGEISELISDGNYSNAQLRMEVLSNLTETQNNLLFTLQIIANLNTIDEYEISEIDHQRLVTLATSSVFQQGFAAINARSILELILNDSYAIAARLGEEFIDGKNCLQTETIGNTITFNSNCDEKIVSILVYDEIGKLLFETTNSYLELTKLKHGFNVLHITTNLNSYSIKKIVR